MTKTLILLGLALSGCAGCATTQQSHTTANSPPCPRLTHSTNDVAHIKADERQRFSTRIEILSVDDQSPVQCQNGVELLPGTRSIHVGYVPKPKGFFLMYGALGGFAAASAADSDRKMYSATITVDAIPGRYYAIQSHKLKFGILYWVVNRRGDRVGDVFHASNGVIVRTNAPPGTTVVTVVDQEPLTKVPALGDVPVVGRLFRSGGTSRKTTISVPEMVEDQ